MRHALAVGALALAFVVAGSVTRWDLAPRWYHLLSVSLIVPTVWLGGRMRVQEVAVAPRSRVGGTATRANARAA
jgi:hypothetical protein